MLPVMEPVQILADKSSDNALKATAPAAAHWLAHPAHEKAKVSRAMLLAAEPPWTGSLEETNGKHKLNNTPNGCA